MQLGSSQYYYRERQAGIWYGLDCFPLLCTFSLIIIERRILAEEVEKKRLLQSDIFNFFPNQFPKFRFILLQNIFRKKSDQG